MPIEAGSSAHLNDAAHCTSESGLDAFNGVAPRDAREYGVSVTVLNPGLVTTEG
ncbi:MAG: hypothetical protein AB1486_07995 [Planctomycetota bacterium]